MSPLEQIETGTFATPSWLTIPRNSVRVVSWNINRGLHLDRVIEFLAGAKADILLLQEADQNARRTHHINVAKKIAQKLRMNYVFGREFQELTQRTLRAEPRASLLAQSATAAPRLRSAFMSSVGDDWYSSSENGRCEGNAGLRMPVGVI